MEMIDQRGTLHSTMAVRFAGNESIFPILRSHKSIVSPEAPNVKTTVLLEGIKTNFQLISPSK